MDKSSSRTEERYLVADNSRGWKFLTADVVSKAVHQTVGNPCPSSPRVDFWTLLTSSHVSVNHDFGISKCWERKNQQILFLWYWFICISIYICICNRCQWIAIMGNIKVHSDRYCQKTSATGSRPHFRLSMQPPKNNSVLAASDIMMSIREFWCQHLQFNCLN